jgi:bacterioferritin
MARQALSAKKEPTLLDDLNQALAGETLAAFRYLYLSKIATGISSLPVSKLFKEMADGEWDHASRFMERIIQLGGVPISKPVEWEKRAFYSPPEPPRRGNDLKSMIKESLRLERASLEFYQRLATKTRDTDMVTHKMALDAISDEAREERKLTALLD